jgi:hypothetical protein
VKFSTNLETGELTTEILKRGEPYPFDEVKTVTDLTYHLRFQSTARFVIAVNKVWADKIPPSKYGPRYYGVTLKCLQIDITNDPPERYLESAIKYLRKNCIFEPTYTCVDANNDNGYGKRYLQNVYII